MQFAFLADHVEVIPELARLLHEAKRLNAPKLHLFTPDKEAWYSKRGWIKIESSSFKEIPITLMEYPLM